MKEEGRPARDIADHFAILAVRENSVIQNVVKQGMKCRPQSYNGLGECALLEFKIHTYNKIYTVQQFLTREL